MLAAPSWWAVGIVLAGYLVALGSTPPGQGWRLLGHLAHAHGASALVAPEYLLEGAPVHLSAIPTLRSTEGHAAGRADVTVAPLHTHGYGPAHRHAAHPAPPETTREAPATGREYHAHGGLVHSHAAVPVGETPAREVPVALARVSVDTHQAPEALRLPAPPARSDAPEAAPVAALASVDESVETPPPLARG